MKKYIFAILYGLIVTIFTVYVVLDTFVITKTYKVVEISNVATNDSSSKLSKNENKKEKSTRVGMQKKREILKENDVVQQDTEGNTSTDTNNTTITQNTYKDENIEITLKEYNEYDTKIYVADVVVSNAEYLKTAFANDTYGKNVTQNTSTIASNKNAILAINGDYYGVQEKGYVLKNGVIYRETAVKNQEDLVIYKDGSMEIINESDITLKELLEKGAYNILSFGPTLVEESKLSVSQNEEVGKAMASNPRTAIGIIDDLHYVFVVSDGRTSESEGLSLYQLAEFMQRLGVETAYNLDGGGSSTMYFNGQVINNPTTNGKSIKERSVSDIVYIGY